MSDNSNDMTHRMDRISNEYGHLFRNPGGYMAAEQEMMAPEPRDLRARAAVALTLAAVSVAIWPLGIIPLILALTITMHKDKVDPMGYSMACAAAVLGGITFGLVCCIVAVVAIHPAP